MMNAEKAIGTEEEEGTDGPKHMADPVMEGRACDEDVSPWKDGAEKEGKEQTILWVK